LRDTRLRGLSCGRFSDCAAWTPYQLTNIDTVINTHEGINYFCSEEKNYSV
jgi:hypothetical protein